MTPSSTIHGETHPYLRAASAGLRRHTTTRHLAGGAADRAHLDLLHAHLIACHHLVDQLDTATRPTSPTAGRHLATTRTRLWQAAAAVHDAFHTLPLTDRAGTTQVGDPPFVTICQRHQAAVHTVRRTTTSAEIDAPVDSHTTTCTR